MRFGSICRERAFWRTAAAVAVAGLTPVLAQTVRVMAQTEAPVSAASPRPGVFRSTSELVMRPVTVTNAQGNYVPNLTMEDFAVFEERVPQSVTLTAAAPLDLLLLIDASSSMTDRIVTQQAAITVIHVLRPTDRAAIGMFNDRVQIAQPLTSDQGLLEQALCDVTPRGLTALYQALYVGFREMAKWRREDHEIRRQAAIVLSDGEDTSSIHVAFEDVLGEARRGAVAVFTIFPGAAIPVPILSVRAHLEHASFDLKMLAEDTGGRAFRPTHPDELSNAYAQITDELAQQYWLGYVPPRHTGGGFKQVSVRIVNRPELRTRTRRGYDASDPHLRTSSGAHESVR